MSSKGQGVCLAANKWFGIHQAAEFHVGRCEIGNTYQPKQQLKNLIQNLRTFRMHENELVQISSYLDMQYTRTVQTVWVLKGLIVTWCYDSHFAFGVSPSSSNRNCIQEQRCF